MPKREIELVANTLNKKSINITCTLSPQLKNIDLEGDVIIVPTNLDQVNNVLLQYFNSINRWHCAQKIGWPIMLWILWLLTLILIIALVACIVYYIVLGLLMIISSINCTLPKPCPSSNNKRQQKDNIKREDHNNKESDYSEWILLPTEGLIRRYIPIKLRDQVANIRERLQNDFVDSFKYYRNRFNENKFKIESPGTNTSIIFCVRNAFCPMGNKEGNRSMNEFLCNRSLLSNVTYHVNTNLVEEVGTIRYETDRYGRVCKVSTNLNDCFSKLSKYTKRNEKYIRDACHLKDSYANDDGGHLIAHDYNGPDDGINIVPMPLSLNRGDWLNMESNLFISVQ